MKHVYSRTISTRRILGTDYPIVSVVYKSGRKWVSAVLCNGVAESSAEFLRKSSAVSHASFASVRQGDSA